MFTNHLRRRNKRQSNHVGQPPKRRIAPPLRIAPEPVAVAITTKEHKFLAPSEEVILTEIKAKK
jgi:hypothetical protein